MAVSVWWIAAAMICPPVALLYDHLLTLDLEVQHIWAQPKRRSAISYFILRYLVSCGEISVLVFRFYTMPSFDTCSRYQMYISAYTSVVEVMVPILLTMRVYAMYECRRYILWTLCITLGCLLPVVVWSVVVSSLGTVLLEGLVCDRFLPEKKATYLAITWGCALAFDTLIFCLIARISFQTRKTYSEMEIQIPLMSLMVRDVPPNNHHHFHSWHSEQATRSSSMTAFTRDLSATMVLRLMLNLHENVSKGVLQTDTSNDEHELNPRSAMMFNTNPALVSGIGTTMSMAQPTNSTATAKSRNLISSRGSIPSRT
ncbi:hypothetical protein GGU10DRAFT_359665 [Lentinula aff. detonsa]|uniref:DUF6533 domain-containing protein n=1 Tax=Lentinula aff. detonsa TaxID=2804958 RepID=A0AA38KVC9_9AGAR|nr:hypothetical protein GGU10DRAFT_359665 [Lentinula aff. detonsa]